MGSDGMCSLSAVRTGSSQRVMLPLKILAIVGESVREQTPHRDRWVGKRCAAGEPVGSANVGAHRGRRQARPPGAGQREDQRDQPGGGHHLPDKMASADPVFSGELEDAAVIHQVGQQRTADTAADLRGQVGRGGADGDTGAGPPAQQPVRAGDPVTTGLKCAPEIGPNNKISTASPNAVVVEFSNSCSPTSCGDSFSAAIPDPTTTVTSRAAPTNSATSRRCSRIAFTLGSH